MEPSLWEREWRLPRPARAPSQAAANFWSDVGRWWLLPREQSCSSCPRPAVSVFSLSTAPAAASRFSLISHKCVCSCRMAWTPGHSDVFRTCRPSTCRLGARSQHPSRVLGSPGLGGPVHISQRNKIIFLWFFVTIFYGFWFLLYKIL